jgi:hypothetical protein
MMMIPDLHHGPFLQLKPIVIHQCDDTDACTRVVESFSLQNRSTVSIDLTTKRTGREEEIKEALPPVRRPGLLVTSDEEEEEIVNRQPSTVNRRSRDRQ